MEKSRKNKKIILIVLLLLVVGLSIGFAAFSTNLKISSSASVTPGNEENTFKVVFSESSTEVTGSKPTSSSEGGATVGNNASFAGSELTNLSVDFTDRGQKATWTLYAYNSGLFDAFLNSVTFENARNTETSEVYSVPLKGIAKSGTTQSYVDDAVSGMKLTIQIGNSNAYAVTTNSIENHKLEQEKGEKVIVTLEYPSTAALADGDFTVYIGDILLGYGSVDSEN